MDAAELHMIKNRLVSLERELLGIASHLDAVDGEQLKELTFAEIEARYVTETTQLIRLRYVIKQLNETIEAF